MVSLRRANGQEGGDEERAGRHFSRDSRQIAKSCVDDLFLLTALAVVATDAVETMVDATAVALRVALRVAAAMVAMVEVAAMAEDE